MHFDTQHVEIGQKMAEIAKNVVKECVKLHETQITACPCMAGSNNTSQTPQTDLKQLRNQRDGRTETQTYTLAFYV